MAILVSALNPGTQNEDVGWGDGIYHCAVTVDCAPAIVHAVLRFLVVMLKYSN